MGFATELLMPGDGASNPYVVPGTNRRYFVAPHAAAVPATSYFSEDGISNFAAGDTVEVANNTFTFVSPIGSTAGNVLVGSDFAHSAANLANAVNGQSGHGVTYIATASATTATAKVIGTGVLFTAKTGGTAGNSLASVYTPNISGADAGFFPAVTFAGGAAAVAGSALSANGDDARLLRSVGWVGMLGMVDLGAGTTANRPANPLKGQGYNDSDVGAVIVYGGPKTGWLNVTTGASA